jgi:hypothetical protein
MTFIQALGNFFKKLFKESIQAQIDIILPIARNVVKSIAEDPTILTSDEKRARAASMIVSELTAKEIVFAKRLINLVIEIAVIELKGIS